jgi:chromosome segregation protein
LRLTEIKLAGFKSFVDPTHIPVPGQLVGVVGPNGCGKSNIIDAVRWVLGESSARHLRGETMQDVLFNGGGSRQPVNRASVELVFDNSTGKAGGQWTSYGEISVKRVIERNKESAYYINNIHVRRRDVADIFLGTGLGARAYAIIEQGMISRIVEARPEDLRVFLEEAAGVSKYRERRHETELRLADTHGNLSRVEDIRIELARQIEHLQSQAEVARHYYELQAKLRIAQNLLALQKKREAGVARERCARDIAKLNLELEAEVARLRATERRIEEARLHHSDAGVGLNVVQGEFYKADAELARVQQQLEHVRDNRQRIESQLMALREQLAQAGNQLKAQRGGLDEWRQTQYGARQKVEMSRTLVTDAATRLPVIEQAFDTVREQRDTLQRVTAENVQELQLERARYEHAQKNLAQLAQRVHRLREEHAALVVPDAGKLEHLRQYAAELNARCREERNRLESEEESIARLEGVLRKQDTVVDAAAQKVTTLEARITALKQIQDRIARSKEMQGWLATHRLDSAHRLWQDLEIEAGWEDALEAVLRERLNGVGLDNLEQASSLLGDLPPGKITVYAAGAAAPVAAEGFEPLAAYVRCKNTAVAGALNDWLHQVYVVRSRNDGLARRGQLPAGALLVSIDGHVFTRHSVSFYAPDSELHGVLSRQREMEQLEPQFSREHKQLTDLKSEHARSEAEFEQRRAALEGLRAAVDESQKLHHETQLEALKLSEQAQHAVQRGAQIAAELAEIETQSGQERTACDSAQSKATELDRHSDELQIQSAVAAAVYQQAEAALEQQRRLLHQAERTAQEDAFHLQTCINKIDEINNAIALIIANVEKVNTGVLQYEREFFALDETPLNAELERTFMLRGQKEQALAVSRDAVAMAETELRQIEQERLTVEQNMGPLRERIVEIKLKEQEASTNEEQFSQQLVEAGADEHMLEPLLEKNKRSNALQADATRYNNEIVALGAVNLAALEELETAQQRKGYLDSQAQDLAQAVATLEDAIRRIDRETRERLQQTFDEVNGHFSRLFPALFGGGSAQLSLTGEEILDSGVEVTAQPPGKKNRLISQLSGGEKALTAMALVFALFHLNPAPFCLLDEVDAPLDDTNTERFCELVKKMSESSQFLFISHNKITMEIANQLIGITMQEAGVSRVVTVDIEEAMKLADKEKAA